MERETEEAGQFSDPFAYAKWGPSRARIVLYK